MNNSLNIEKIQEIIFAYAKGDFSKRLPISEKCTEIDLIFSGINSLGEELEEKSVSRDFLQFILNAIPQIVIVFDQKGDISLINKIGINYLINVSTFSSLNIKELFSLQMYKQIKDQTKAKKLNANFQLNFCCLPNKDTPANLLCSINDIIVSKKKQFLFVAKDITHEKDNEKKSLKETILGQELERKRLAYDLHDSLGQDLSSIKLYLQAMEKMKNSSIRFQKSLSEVYRILDESIDSVRSISYKLTPNLSKKNNFLSHLISLINGIKTVEFETRILTTNLVFNNQTEEFFVFRIFQEFIANSVQHSKAKTIFLFISPKVHKNKILFSLMDNGIGFDFDSIENKNGLINITNRLNALNCVYSFTSLPKHGTKLNFELKINYNEFKKNKSLDCRRSCND